MLKRFFSSRKRPYVPGLNKLERLDFDLSGNKLSMVLPPHSDYEGFEAGQVPRQILGLPRMEYCESFKGEPSVVILKPGSPAPEFVQ